MSQMSFAHVVRGLLVAIGLLLAVTQIKVLVSQPSAPLALDAIFSIAMVGR